MLYFIWIIFFVKIFAVFVLIIFHYFRSVCIHYKTIKKWERNSRGVEEEKGGEGDRRFNNISIWAMGHRRISLYIAYGVSPPHPLQALRRRKFRGMGEDDLFRCTVLIMFWQANMIRDPDEYDGSIDWVEISSRVVDSLSKRVWAVEIQERAKWRKWIWWICDEKE